MALHLALTLKLIKTPNKKPIPVAKFFCRISIKYERRESFGFRSLIFFFLNNFQNSVEGLTGLINFENGQRNSFYIEVLEYQRNNDPIDPYNKIAKYRYPWPDPSKKVELLRNFSAGSEEADMNMQSKVFKVMMRESSPFCMKK